MSRKFTARFLLVFSAAAFFIQPAFSQKSIAPTPLDTKHPDFVNKKTVVAEVVFKGLDTRFEYTDYDAQNPIYESDISLFLKHEKAQIANNEKFDLLRVETVLRLLKGICFKKVTLKRTSSLSVKDFHEIKCG